MTATEDALPVHEPLHATPGGLPFRLYQPRPGHPDWTTLAAEAHQLAERLRPLLTPPEPRLQRVRRQSAALWTAAATWRENRRRHLAGDEALRPFMLLWTALRTCNFACTYCDDHQGHKYPDLPREGALETQDALRLLRIMRSRASSVYFAGGEPTVRDDLPAIARAARDLDCFPIVVNTNGSLLHRKLARPEWAGWLADMDVIIVSLDALDLDLLRRMWVTRHPEVVIRNLLMLRELSAAMRFDLMVNVVIQRDTLDEASAVIDLANDLGIGVAVVPMNIGPRVDPALIADPAYHRLVDRILARHQAGYRFAGSLRLNRRLLRAEGLTCRNTLKPHVDFDGRLIWPCKASVNVPPVPIDVLQFEDVDSLYDHAVAQISPTGFHGPARNQCGAQCNWAQNYATDAYAHGLSHPWSLVREVLGFAFGDRS